VMEWTGHEGTVIYADGRQGGAGRAGTGV
jgi:hypothetical protein